MNRQNLIPSNEIAVLYLSPVCNAEQTAIFDNRSKHFIEKNCNRLLV